MLPLEVCDRLNAEELRAALGQSYIGNEIVAVEDVSSTNDLVWQMAQAGAASGLVVFADRQSAGRGQRGNIWESPPQVGLWLSILLRPRLEPADSARLTDWAAQAIALTIRDHLQVSARIKPPNDIYLEARKIAGVLVEMRVKKNGDYAAIVGIGVNVNQTAANFSEQLRDSAGSLAMATGKEIDRQRFAIALLQQLDRTYRILFTV